MLYHIAEQNATQTLQETVRLHVGVGREVEANTECLAQVGAGSESSSLVEEKNFIQNFELRRDQNVHDNARKSDLVQIVHQAMMHNAMKILEAGAMKGLEKAILLLQAIVSSSSGRGRD